LYTHRRKEEEEKKKKKKKKEEGGKRGQEIPDLIVRLIYEQLHYTL